MPTDKKNANSAKGANPNDVSTQNVQEPSNNTDLIEVLKVLIATSEKNNDDKVKSGVDQCDKIVSLLRERLDSDRNHNDNEIFKLYESVEKLRAENQALLKRVENSEERIKFLEGQLTSTNDDIDDLEQSRRGSYLVVNNLPHESGTTDEQAFLNMCETKINVGPDNLSIIKSKISDVHRFHVAKNDRNQHNVNSTGRPRPLVVRFTDHKYRDIVYKKKKALKNSGIVITEYLTKRRSNLLKLCFEKVPGSNTERSIWTDNGKILVKLIGKDIVHIKDINDLNLFLREHCPSPGTIV